MKKGLALYDMDIIYATRFMEYLKNKKDFEYHLTVFTQKEAMKAYLQLHKTEILILGSIVDPEDIPEGSVKLLCRLEEEGDQKLIDNQIGLSKYQPVCQIMNEIITFYKRTTEGTETILRKKQVKLMTVFSLKSEKDPLIFAWSIAQIASRKQKVLFLSLELLPVSIIDTVDESRQSLSELIYYLKEKQNIIPKMKALLQYGDNLDYLLGIMHGFDLLSLSQEDISNWINEIKSYMDYSVIIFYASYYHEASIELLQQSETIILPTGSSMYDTALVKEWERQLNQLGIVFENDRCQIISWDWNQEDNRRYQSLTELSTSRAWKAAEEYLEH